MFFWLSLGVFVGLATASAISYRKEMNQQLSGKKNPKLLPSKNGSDDFLKGDKLVYDTEHFIISHVARATDGVKKLCLGELESNEKVLLWLKDHERTWCKALCEIDHLEGLNEGFSPIFQYDGVHYTHHFETRMKILNPGKSLLSQSETILIRMYQAKNRHLFSLIIQDGEHTRHLKGETHLENDLMILPKS